MLLDIINAFLIYFQENWASVLTWILLITVLSFLRTCQLKWKREKDDLLTRSNIVTIRATTSGREENIKNIKRNCDALEHIFDSANDKLESNGSNVDKEILELVYKLASQKQNKMYDI